MAHKPTVLHELVYSNIRVAEKGMQMEAGWLGMKISSPPVLLTCMRNEDNSDYRQQLCRAHELN